MPLWISGWTWSARCSSARASPSWGIKGARFLVTGLVTGYGLPVTLGDRQVLRRRSATLPEPGCRSRLPEAGSGFGAAAGRGLRDALPRAPVRLGGSKGLGFWLL